MPFYSSRPDWYIIQFGRTNGSNGNSRDGWGPKKGPEGAKGVARWPEMKCGDGLFASCLYFYIVDMYVCTYVDMRCICMISGEPGPL